MDGADACHFQQTTDFQRRQALAPILRPEINLEGRGVRYQGENLLALKLRFVQQSAVNSHQFGVMSSLERLQGGDGARRNLRTPSQAAKNGVLQDG